MLTENCCEKDYFIQKIGQWLLTNRHNLIKE